MIGQEFQVHTFGCKVNTYDSGMLQKNLSTQLGKLDSEKKIHVLNTCAVTAEATKEAVRLARRIKANDPLALVVVTGCAAQVDTDSFSGLPGVDLVVANSHKGMLSEIIKDFYKGKDQKVFKSNIFRKDDLEAGFGLEGEHTRSFLKIQDGCNSFCSYCVIPYARGKSRSLSIDSLVKRVQEISDSGIKEVVLTGIHIADYQDETRKENNVLEDLVENVLKRTQIARIRLSSLEPKEVSSRLLEIYQDERICKHFHMSIQSANTKVLTDMKRRYNQQDVIESLNQIQSRLGNVFIGMDVIVGFPTESESDFEDTYKVLCETPWTRIHVFPYSERPGTKATSLIETVPWEERKKRAQLLRQLSSTRFQTVALQQIGLHKKVLILNKDSKNSQGLSSDFWPVEISDKEYVENNRGKEVIVKVDKFKPYENLNNEGVLYAVQLS